MNKLNLSDRETIEIGIVRHQPLIKIAELLNKHKSSVSREIKAYRLFIAGSYYAGNGRNHRMYVTDALNADTAPMTSTSMMQRWLTGNHMK